MKSDGNFFKGTGSKINGSAYLEITKCSTQVSLTSGYTFSRASASDKEGWTLEAHMTDWGHGNHKIQFDYWKYTGGDTTGDGTYNQYDCYNTIQYLDNGTLACANQGHVKKQANPKHFVNYNDWQMFAARGYSHNIAIYKDALKLNDDFENYKLVMYTDNLSIGGIHNRPDKYLWRGGIDDVRVYSRTLTDAAIAVLHGTQDVHKPLIGADGYLTMSTTGSHVAWMRAIDDHSENSTIQYKVVSHSKNIISTVETAERNGTTVCDWTVNTDICNISSVTDDHWVNVLAKDECGNISAYRSTKKEAALTTNGFLQSVWIDTKRSSYNIYAMSLAIDNDGKVVVGLNEESNLHLDSTYDNFAGVEFFDTSTTPQTPRRFGGSGDMYMIRHTPSDSGAALDRLVGFGKTGHDYPYQIDFDSNNNMYIWGVSDDDYMFHSTQYCAGAGNPGTYCIDHTGESVLAKFDSNFNFKWVMHEGSTSGTWYDDGTHAQSRGVAGLEIDTDDMIYLWGSGDMPTNGQTASGNTHEQLFLVKTNENGSRQYTYVTGTTGASIATDAEIHGDHIYTLSRNTTGAYTSSPTASVIGSTDALVEKRNKSDGTVVWRKMIGSTALDYPGHLAVAADGDVFVSFTSRGNPTFDNGTAFPSRISGSSKYDIFVVRLDGSDGAIEWAVAPSQSNLNDIPVRMLLTPDQCHVVLLFWSNGHFYNNSGTVSSSTKVWNSADTNRSDYALSLIDADDGVEITSYFNGLAGYDTPRDMAISPIDKYLYVLIDGDNDLEANTDGTSSGNDDYTIQRFKLPFTGTFTRSN